MNILQRLANDAQQAKNKAFNGVGGVVNRDVIHPVTNFANHVDNRVTQSAIGRGAQTVGLAALRSGVGTLQAGSGLYDLASRIHGGSGGQNRFDRTLDRFGKSIDQTAGAEHSNPLLYHGAQAATDALQLYMGGGEVKAAGRGLAELPKVGQAFKMAGKGLQAIERPAQAVAKLGKDGNYAQRVTSKAASTILSPRYQAANLAFTAGQTGKDASHGKPVTTKGVATNLAIGGVGLPIVGAALGEGAKLALPALEKGAKTTIREAKLAKTGTSQNQGITTLQNRLQGEIKGHQADIKKLNLSTDAGQRAHEQLQRKIDQKAGQIKQLDATKVQQTAVQKVVGRYANMQPGLTAGGDGTLNKLGTARKGKQAAAEATIAFSHDPAQAQFKGLQPNKQFPNSYDAGKLTDALDYPALFEKYPQLKDYKVEYHDISNHDGAPEGIHYAKKKVISLDRDMSDSEKLSTLMHEVQHAIQGHEGRLDGQSSVAKLGYHGYKDNPIEVEARQIGEMYARPTEVPATPLPARPEPVTAPAIQPAAGGQVAPSEASVAQPHDVPNGYAGKVKQTKFTQTVKNSDQVSPEVQAQVDSSYTSDTTQGALDRAQQSIQANGGAPALEQTLAELNTKRGTASRDTLAQAIELAKQHDASGTEADQAIAARLYDLVAEHGSAHGQGSQILAAIARSSPAGLRNKAFRDLKQAGIDVLKPGNEAIRTEIQGHIDAITKLPDGPAKDMAIAVMQKAVAKHLPQGKINNALSLWKAGLLSGVKTQQGNAISNGTFAALKKASDVPATAVDKLISLKTGERTKSLTLGGSVTGTKQGAKNAVTTLRTGIDTRTIGDKYEQHAEINFGNKVMQNVLAKPANLVFRGMSAADQPFWYSALKNSLYDQAKADGINKGLRGQALRDHMEQLATNPTEKLADTATAEANKATLNYDTVGSRAVSAIKRSIDQSNMSDAGKQTTQAVVNVIAPFTRVPSAFIARTVDFTPLGIPKTVIGQVSRGKFDQRALSQAIGEATTGTGVIALGIALSQKNLLSGDYPKNDPKEAQRWKAEGITPNSIKLGGKWISLNYLGPVGLLFNAGHQFQQAKGEAGYAKVAKAVGGLGQGLLGQSFLQGLSGFSDAIKDPGRYGSNLANSQAASVVPSIVNDVANATDHWQRQVNGVGESIENRVPGLRESNPVKQDVYGNPLAQNNALLATKPSASLTNTSPAVAEVSRLHGVNPNDSNLQVTPQPVGKALTVEGKQVPLSDKQRYDLQSQLGQATQSRWNELIKTDAYKAMDDTQKAAALNNIKTLVAEDTTRAFVVKNNLGEYNKPESAKAVSLSQNGSVADLAASKATGGSSGTPIKIDGDKKTFLTKYNAMNTDQRTQAEQSQNDFEYRKLAAQYDNNKANNKLTKAQDVQAQASLQKARIGKDYSKDTRDLYGLSKQELAYVASNDLNGDKLVNDVIAYGDALEKAGIAKNKFRDKYGNVSTSPTATSGRSSSTSSGLKLAKAFKTPYSDQIKSRSKGAQLARSAHLVKKKR